MCAVLSYRFSNARTVTATAFNDTLQLCCSHDQSDRPTLETILLKLQQLHASLASCASTDADGEVSLLKALVEHEYTSDSIDHQVSISHVHQQLPPIHQAILRGDVLAVKSIAAMRYRPTPSQTPSTSFDTLIVSVARA